MHIKNIECRNKTTIDCACKTGEGDATCMNVRETMKTDKRDLFEEFGQRSF